MINIKRILNLRGHNEIPTVGTSCVTIDTQRWILQDLSINMHLNNTIFDNVLSERLMS